MNIFIDLETIPTQIPEERQRIAETIHPPANYSKPDTIAKWWAEKGVQAKDDAWRATALDGGWCQIVCVGLAAVGGDVGVIHNEDERALLLDANKTLADLAGGQHVTFVGHNVGWDLRVFHHRCVVNQIVPFVHIPYNDEPWRGSYFCTQYEWAGRRDHVSLTELCRILSIDIEDSIDGSDVWDAWSTGVEANRELVIEHCRADVERVRQIYKRLRFEA